jgi:hypothetical protein
MKLQVRKKIGKIQERGALGNIKAQFGKAQSFELTLSNLWTACLSDTGLITTNTAL